VIVETRDHLFEGSRQCSLFEETFRKLSPTDKAVRQQAVRQESARICATSTYSAEKRYSLDTSTRVRDGEIQLELVSLATTSGEGEVNLCNNFDRIL